MAPQEQIWGQGHSPRLVPKKLPHRGRPHPHRDGPHRDGPDISGGVQAFLGHEDQAMEHERVDVLLPVLGHGQAWVQGVVVNYVDWQAENEESYATIAEWTNEMLRESVKVEQEPVDYLLSALKLQPKPFLVLSEAPQYLTDKWNCPLLRGSTCCHRASPSPVVGLETSTFLLLQPSGRCTPWLEQSSSGGCRHLGTHCVCTQWQDPVFSLLQSTDELLLCRFTGPLDTKKFACHCSSSQGAMSVCSHQLLLISLGQKCCATIWRCSYSCPAT